jgi:hypothetical protein
VEKNLVIYPIGENPVPVANKTINITITSTSEGEIDPLSNAQLSNISFNPPGYIKRFGYETQGDGGFPTGIFYYLGSNGATTNYTNVTLSGNIETYASTVKDNSLSLYGPDNLFIYDFINTSNPFIPYPDQYFIRLFERLITRDIFISQDTPNSYFVVKFNNNYSVLLDDVLIIAGETLLTRSYNVQLYGSNNLASLDSIGVANATWDLVYDFANEVGSEGFLDGDGSTILPMTGRPNTYYSAYRFVQSGLNRNINSLALETDVFSFTNIEFFGTLRQL